MQNLDKLVPKVRRMAEELIVLCEKEGIEIKITQTFRSIDEQNALYAQVRTKPGKIVTNAKGGASFHNYGVAFDFCPVVKGKLAWKNTKLFTKVGELGESIGLSWGGRWKRFKDLPHFEYTAGYKIVDFQKHKINLEEFE